MKTPAVKKHEKGQSLVELGVSMVLVLILLSGIVDLGRAVFTLLAMQDAAEEGLVYGVGFPSYCTQIEERIRYNLSNEVLPTDVDVHVYIENAAGTVIIKGLKYSACADTPYNQIFAEKHMQIDLTQDFQITMPFLGSFIGQEIPLHATANGVILRPQPQ